MQPLVRAAQAGLLGQTNQRAFGGIADDAEIGVLFFEPGIVADKGAVEQTAQRVPMGDRFQRQRLTVMNEFALGPITDAGNLDLLPSTAISVAIMRFCVKVPVLSQQITVVQPRVSTDGKLFTSAWRLAMRCTPMARERVTVGSNPSGTLATNRPMQNTKASRKVRPATNQPRNRKAKPKPPASAVIA